MHTVSAYIAVPDLTILSNFNHNYTGTMASLHSYNKPRARKGTLKDINMGHHVYLVRLITYSHQNNAQNLLCIVYET